MPCYRFRFRCPELPLYYYGHVLPPPMIHLILQYASEMTVWSGVLRLAATATDPFLLTALQADSTASVASPTTAAMVPCRTLPASSINSPRFRTR